MSKYQVEELVSRMESDNRQMVPLIPWKISLFIRFNWVRRWVLIIGEGIAFISGSLVFVPGLPDKIDEIVIPLAVVVGAGALLIVAIYDKLDPTMLRVCRTPNKKAYDLLREQGLMQNDVMYWWPED